MQRIYTNGKFTGYICKKHGIVHGIQAPRAQPRAISSSRRHANAKDEREYLIWKWAGVFALAYVVLVVLLPIVIK